MVKIFYPIALCYLTTLLLIVNGSRAQNLVPNGDFETIRGCSGLSSSGYPDVVDSAANWLNPTLATPDYFNPCTGSVPANVMGYQAAHSGVGYGGLYIWSGMASAHPNYREYMSVQLTSTLVAGTSYHFQMYVNLSSRYYHVTTNAVGAYFTPSFASFATQDNLPVIPQVFNTTGFVTDTTNWVLIQGDFTASGGERFLTIGNFRNYITSDSLIQTPGPITEYLTYIYIDDVSLTKISTGIDDITSVNAVNIYPNPAKDQLTITIDNNEQNELSIYDITSRKMYSRDCTNNTSIDLHDLANGVYLYEVRNKIGMIKRGKFIKE